MWHRLAQTFRAAPALQSAGQVRYISEGRIHFGGLGLAAEDDEVSITYPVRIGAFLPLQRDGRRDPSTDR